MPSRLRPTAPLAADAILVGDPGRALLLAQELLEQPRMSNHARGLWGYSGQTPAGDGLTIQATGMGGPSAAMVLADLAKLGVRRAIRVGTCAGHAPDVEPGELLLAAEALAGGGSATSFGVAPGEAALPDPDLFGALERRLGDDARPVRVASLDALPAASAAELPDGVAAADMQTVAVLARGRELGIAAAALLIVSEARGERLDDEALESASKRAGRAAEGVLSA
jgi:uridine phosphorylase